MCIEELNKWQYEIGKLYIETLGKELWRETVSDKIKKILLLWSMFVVYLGSDDTIKRNNFIICNHDMKLSQEKVVIAMLRKCMVKTNNIFQYDSESCFLGLYHYLLEYYFL